MQKKGSVFSFLVFMVLLALLITYLANFGKSVSKVGDTVATSSECGNGVRLYTIGNVKNTSSYKTILATITKSGKGIEEQSFVLICGELADEKGNTDNTVKLIEALGKKGFDNIFLYTEDEDTYGDKDLKSAGGVWLDEDGCTVKLDKKGYNSSKNAEFLRKVKLLSVNQTDKETTPEILFILNDNNRKAIESSSASLKVVVGHSDTSLMCDVFVPMTSTSTDNMLKNNFMTDQGVKFTSSHFEALSGDGHITLSLGNSCPSEQTFNLEKHTVSEIEFCYIEQD